MKVILFQPQIPQNTGNIVRTCKVVGASLLLVRPIGFSTSDKALKRAGLDYWDGVDVEFIDDLYLDSNLDSNGNIQSIICKNSVNHNADLFVDCTV